MAATNDFVDLKAVFVVVNELKEGLIMLSRKCVENRQTDIARYLMIL